MLSLGEPVGGGTASRKKVNNSSGGRRKSGQYNVHDKATKIVDPMDAIQSLFFTPESGGSTNKPPGTARQSGTATTTSGGRVSSLSAATTATMEGVSPSGDSLSSRGSRVGGEAFLRSEVVLDEVLEERQQDNTSTITISRDDDDGSSRQQQQQRGGGSSANRRGATANNVGPVDRLLLLVDEAQSLSKRVLGNERQSARLGDRLSALKNPLWQLQARVRTQAVRPPGFVHDLTEQVQLCLLTLLELAHPDWWNQIRRKHDALLFRELNERLVAAVRGGREFEAALTFPRAADEDRADRIVDFEHLQRLLEMHSDRLEDRVEEREELWKAIEGLRLAEPSDITGFTE
ncbi:unnamed protein product, partial [Ectocarpus sp. 4 AP-2014]